MGSVGSKAVRLIPEQNVLPHCADGRWLNAKCMIIYLTSISAAFWASFLMLFALFCQESKKQFVNKSTIDKYHLGRIKCIYKKFEKLFTDRQQQHIPLRKGRWHLIDTLELSVT